MGDTATIVCSLIGIALLTLLQLGYGIAEAVILSGSTDAKGECGAAIWYNILVCCILHMIAGVVTPCVAAVAMSSDDEDSKPSSSSALGLGVAIWSCVIYFDTATDCKNTFQDLYPHLWNAVEAEVILFFIVLGIFGLVIFGLICWGIYERAKECCGCCQDRPATRRSVV